MKLISGATALVIAVAGPAAAQDNPWTWSKVIPAGQTVAIRGVQGDITATPAAGNRVEVIARKSATDGDPADVTFEVVEDQRGVTICAIYQAARTRCSSDGYNHGSMKQNDTRVDFEVRLPRGVALEASTVSGRIDATGLSADVGASTVSGSIRVSTTGMVRASSVSGSIRARMGNSADAQQLAYSSVSGDIVLEFAGDLNADITMSTVSGDLDSDWPLVTSNTSRGRLRGRIGSGGTRLSLSTVSGDVELRRAN